MGHRVDIDILKGFAIIAVILYHIGILPYGFLGVDIFLVISGFLIIPPVINNINVKTFSYFKWLWKRIKRFIPLVVLACATSLAIGYFVMMPDDYENLAASSFATEIFCNNILQAITTGNYWDSVSEYKPLLAFWYLGVIVQFFVFYPLFLILIKLILKKGNNKKSLIKATIILCFFSFMIYIIPFFNYNFKFYYLPFRFWEICLGGLFFFIFNKRSHSFKLIYIVLIIFLFGVFCYGIKSFDEINTLTIVGVEDNSKQFLIPREFALIVTVLCTAFLLLFKIKIRKNIISIIGQMSLSLFIWHQIFLAFMRYSLADEINLTIFIFYLFFIFIISWLSFKYVENIKFNNKNEKILWLSGWVAILSLSLLIYFMAGVMRDIPEMGVSTKDRYAVRNTEYIDKIYEYDKPFITNKKKVLLIGYSFTRDFACCLLEWEGSKDLELSYTPEPKENDERFSKADYIFFFGKKSEIPSFILEDIKPSTKIFGIGTKYFGKSFGTVFAKRNSDEYFNLSIPIPEKLKKVNEEWELEWGDNYINFVDASLNANGNIQLFTPENMIISFDCRHLSPAGAKFFSKKFNFEKIFNIK